MRNKLLAGMIAVFLFFAPLSVSRAEVQAAIPAIDRIAMENDLGSLCYPQLSGMADAALQQKINDDIIISANVTAHMITFATLTPDSLWGLRVSYESYVTDRVASFVITAEGKMPNGRQGYESVALSYDLATGLRLTAQDLFADPAAAREWLEAETVATLGEEISDYEDAAALLPLPMDSFALDAYGITFYYSSQQFKTINGQSGACRFDYTELQHLLHAGEDKLPALLGMLAPQRTVDARSEEVLQALKAAKLDQLPLTLGEPMMDIVETYGLTRTPDEFPGGRYFVMEHPLFRSIWLISDAMQSSYDHSVLEGIQLRRGGIGGLLIGQSMRTDWLELLGEADESMQITENMAYDYRLPAGTCDVFTEGDCAIRFYADEEGVLRAIQFELNRKD